MSMLAGLRRQQQQSSICLLLAAPEEAIASVSKELSGLRNAVELLRLLAAPTYKA